MSKSRHSTVGPARAWKMKREFQAHFLKSVGLSSNSSFLDFGCGTLRGGIPIIDFLDVGKYTGFDVREEVIEQAHKELIDCGLEDKLPVLLHGRSVDSLRSAPESIKYDVIWSFSVVFHLTDGLVGDFLAFVSERLSGAGVCYFNIDDQNLNILDGKWGQFEYARRPVEFYRDLAKPLGLSISCLGTLGSLGHPTYRDHHNQLMLCASLIPGS